MTGTAGRVKMPETKRSHAMWCDRITWGMLALSVAGAAAFGLLAALLGECLR